MHDVTKHPNSYHRSYIPSPTLPDTFGNSISVETSLRRSTVSPVLEEL